MAPEQAPPLVIARVGTRDAFWHGRHALVVNCSERCRCERRLSRVIALALRRRRVGWRQRDDWPRGFVLALDGGLLLVRELSERLARHVEAEILRSDVGLEAANLHLLHARVLSHLLLGEGEAVEALCNTARNTARNTAFKRKPERWPTSQTRAA